MTKKEIEDISKHFDISFINYYSEKDAEMLSIAYSGVDYVNNLGKNNIPDKV